jgi:RHS repeat-associated protein
VTSFGRDEAGRVTSITNANHEVTQFGYDASSLLTSLLDGRNKATIWHYDEFGRMDVKRDDTTREVLHLYYDPNGNVTTEARPLSTITRLFDAVGNVTNISFSGSASNTVPISLAYDKLSRLTNMIDAAGTTGFSYTPTGQLKSEDGPWSNDTLVYDYLQGHRSAFTINSSSPSSINYSYDGLWRLTNIVSAAGSFGYSYHSAVSPLVQSIALPNLAGISNHFDSLGRLDGTALINYWGHTLDGAAYEYAIPDLRTKITRDLGLTTNTVDLAYDDIGQLTKWTGKEPDGAARLNEKLGYGYDPAGNLQYRTNNALVQTFNVNNLNELSTVTRTGTFTVSGSLPAPATNVTVNGSTADRYSDLTFAKDSFNLTNGNNTFGVIASNVYGVRATNSLTLNLPDSVSFQYDTNGNLTGDGLRTFVYDAQNQLTNVYVTNSWKTEFVYDGLGRRRVAKDAVWQSGAWVTNTITRYVFDGMVVVQERDANNTVQVTYTRGLDLAGSLQGAGGIGGLLARTDANGSTFYHADGAGNVTSLMDGQQNVVARYLYDPYGRLISKSGALADVNRYQFSSKEIHPASGLYYYGFRFYDPSLQRWINQDPIGEEGGISLYSFVNNDPVTRVDGVGFDDKKPASPSLPVIISVVPPDSIPKALGYIDDFLLTMRQSENPFTRGIGAGLWGASWLFGGPEMKMVKEAREAEEAAIALAQAKRAAEAEKVAVTLPSITDSRII